MTDFHAQQRAIAQEMAGWDRANPLVTIFAFNLWANVCLYDFCATLDQSQLRANDAGAFGDIHGTLAHIVNAEQGYVHALQGYPANGTLTDANQLSVADMRPLVFASGQQFLALAAVAATLPAVERKRPNGAIWQIPAAYILTQASHHGNEHRTNITTILAKEQIDHPPLSSWDFWEAQAA